VLWFFSVIVGAIVISMLIDPRRHSPGRLVVLLVILALLLGAGAFLMMRYPRREAKELGASEISPNAQGPEADEAFRAVAETASDGIISADENGDIIYWNPAAEKIFGYSTAQARGRSLTLLMPERLRKAHQEGMKRVVLHGESRLLGKVIELTGLRKDGSEFPLELSLSTWTTSKRRGFTGIVRDITHRKEFDRRMSAEHAVTRFLAESPTLGEVAPKILQAICETLGWEVGAFWRVDQEGDVIRCSDVWHSPSVTVAKFIEFTKQTVFTQGSGLPGRVWASGEPSWITDVLQDANFPRAPLAAREGLHGALCFPIRRPGSVLGVMEFFSRKTQEPDEGLLQMLAAIGSQIGQFMERKRAEEQISSLKEYVQVILDSVPDPIVILNQDAQVQYINGASYRAFNLHPSDVKDRTLFDLLKVDVPTREELRSELGSYTTTTRQPHAVLAVDSRAGLALRDPLAAQDIVSERNRRKEIRFGRRTYHYTCFPVEAHSDEGTLTGIVLRDTTEESSLQDQLIQAEKLAGIALLTSGLGHELNNPLYSVLGLSEAILNEHDAAIMQQHARVIVEEARRMGRIIKDLTGRSAIEASDLRVEVDVNEQLNYALGLTLPVPSEKNLQVEKRFAATGKIWANPFEVRQVFVNIISNAIQAMKGNGMLELASDIDGEGMVRIRIRDSGPGIAAPHVSKIFDPFFTTKKQGEGTGLGLTIARRIVTKHAGHIQVDTQDPQGTTFTVTFPLMDPTI
jgi:PAS domain S-box-containing protein